MSIFALNVGATETPQGNDSKVGQADFESIKSKLESVESSVGNMKADVDSCSVRLDNVETTKVDSDKALWAVVALCFLLIVLIVVVSAQLSNLKCKLAAVRPKDGADNAGNDELQQLVMKISNLEKRLVFAQNRLLVVEMQLKNQGADPNSAAAKPSAANAEKAVDKTPQTFYMPAPNEDGYFDDALRTSTKRQDSVYRFRIQPDGTALFEVDCNDSMKYWIAENRQQVIESVCDLEGTDGFNAHTLAKGVAELSGGKWTVRQRAVVKFV